MFVDVNRGKAEGIALARELEQLSKEEEERDMARSRSSLDRSTTYGTTSQ
jgi:MFS transporter, UMF1 family